MKYLFLGGILGILVCFIFYINHKNQKKYDACIATSVENYEEQWAQACDNQASEQMQKYNECNAINSVYGESLGSLCDSMFPDRNSANGNCELPNAVGSELNSQEQSEQITCHNNYPRAKQFVP